MEHVVSAFGLLVLMGIAYLFSANRKAVSFRTVIWGVCLQLLLAMIILSKDARFSYLGMFILASLLLIYIFEEETRSRGLNPWAVGAVTVAGAAVAVLAFRELGLVHVSATVRLTDVVLGLAVATWLVALKMKRQHVVRIAFAAMLILVVAVLWARDISGQTLFRGMSNRVASFLALSDKGAEFLFGNQYFYAQESSGWPGFAAAFAFKVLPTIVFFSAFIAVLYYLGVVQTVISALAKFMRWSMKTSGSETMSCSANIFVGQTEAPFLIKPFLKDMTISELHAVMVGGFATIAGGVMAGYIAFGISAGHLIAASVMSAPAALVMAKLFYPETEESVTSGAVEMPKIEVADNLVEAATAGTTDGLKLAVNVGAMLLAFISLIAVVDVVLGFLDQLIDHQWLGGALIEGSKEYAGIFPGSLKTLFGTVLRPLAWVMGVPWKDTLAVGNLLGLKLTVNEFVAYGVLAQHIKGELEALDPRSAIIATYALCGFANFSSIGIQIGGISALASWMTATIAGMVLPDV